LLDGPLF